MVNYYNCGGIHFYYNSFSLNQSGVKRKLSVQLNAICLGLQYPYISSSEVEGNINFKIATSSDNQA